MPGQIEFGIHLLAAMPTNPSSLTLALVGVVSLLSYQLLVRPGREAQPPRATHVPANPSATRPQRSHPPPPPRGVVNGPRITLMGSRI